MYGVILWSDPTVGKAVIWCEDHGDLAYYEAPERAAAVEGMFFDAGDYVEFDITVDRDLKRARNAQTVRTDGQEVLSHTLDAPNRSGPHQLMARHAGTSSMGHVIRLADRAPRSVSPTPHPGGFSHRG